MTPQEVYVVVREQGEYSDREVSNVGVAPTLDQARELATQDRHRKWGEQHEHEVRMELDEALQTPEWGGGWRAPVLQGTRVVQERRFGRRHTWYSGTYYIERYVLGGNHHDTDDIRDADAHRQWGHASTHR